MWKKEEPAKSSKSSPFGDEVPEKASKFSSGPPAVIGSSLVIDGTISGEEDLLVEGTVKGDISLPDNVVTVGTSGKVEARIHAAVIVIEGKVKGDLVGEEQIEIRRSGNANGNIVAPRVGLEDGAQFKGNIDMTPNKAPDKSSAKPSQASAQAPSSRLGSAPGGPAATPEKAPNDEPAGKDSDSKLPG